jgi:hypothetical protein
MELRHSSKFKHSLGHSFIENVLKSCANELAELELRATPQLKFFEEPALPRCPQQGIVYANICK